MTLELRAMKAWPQGGVYGIYDRERQIGLWARLGPGDLGGPSQDRPREVVDLVHLDDSVGDRLLVFEWSADVVAATDLRLEAFPHAPLAAVAVFRAGRGVRRASGLMEVRLVEVATQSPEWLEDARRRAPAKPETAPEADTTESWQGDAPVLLPPLPEGQTRGRETHAVALRGWLDARLRLHRPGVGGLVLREPLRWTSERDRLIAGVRAALQVLLLCAALLGSFFAWYGSPFYADAVGWRAAPVLASTPPAPLPLTACDGSSPALRASLRCTVRGVTAGDAGSPQTCTAEGSGGGEDLQVELCGLLDRATEGRLYAPTAGWPTGRSVDAGELSIAQACFVVLGAPRAYSMTPDTASGAPSPWADPDRLLRGPDALGGLVEEVEAARADCTVRRERLEAVVAGAAVGTYVGNGDRGDEALVLRAAVRGVGKESLPSSVGGCFDAGMDEGVRATNEASACGGTGVRQPSPLLNALAGEATAVPVVDRYAGARFASPPTPLTDPPPDLWTCHAELADPAASPAVRVGAWGTPIPSPASYAATSAGSQLTLEAGLTAVRAETPVGACWSAVAATLKTWPAAHPLGGAPVADGWPAPLQQVCGQACAAASGFAPGSERWLTPQTDLVLCMGDSSPAPWLEIPWSGGGILLPPSTGLTRATVPSVADVCGFNLVAQGRLDLGRKSWLPSGLTPRQWAGESAPGVAGGADGAAALAVAAFQGGSLQQPAGAAECGAAAIECFAGLAVDTYPGAGSGWLQRWDARVRTLSQRDGPAVAAHSPWCGLVWPYLRARTVTEELDAMRVMGIPHGFRLVMPRALALAVVMPLISVWTTLMALAGGMLAADLALGITPGFFMNALPKAVDVANLTLALSKSVVFGVLIALIGCHFGLRVKPNTESLGQGTTASVVTSITVVILVDALFAVVFKNVGI